MGELQVFTFGSNDDGIPIRTLDLAGSPWWVAADVCRAMGIKDTSMAVGRLDEDERGTSTIGTLGGPQDLTIINESGLYSLVLTSRQERAKQFKKWITSEVLPSIRRTGRYEHGSNPDYRDRIESDPVMGQLRQMMKMREDVVVLLAQQETLAAGVAEATRVATQAAATATAMEATVAGRTGFLTILGYSLSKGYKIAKPRLAVIGKKVAAAARERSVTPAIASDERYSSVKSWPRELLDSLDDVFKAEDQTKAA